MFKTILPPADYHDKVNQKFVSVDTKDKDCKKLLDSISKNMMHYFSMNLNTTKKIDKVYQRINDRWADMNVCSCPNKDDCNEISDVKNNNSFVYKNFIENLMRKAHDRMQLPFINYIPEKHKKAEFVFSDFFDNKKITVTYYTSPVMLNMSFNKEALTIAYVMNFDTQKMMLEIQIDHNQNIISTEVYFNGNHENETEMISLNKKQVDSLIVLSHYTHDEEIDFNVEQYVDAILTEDYESFLNYIKIKEMIYI